MKKYKLGLIIAMLIWGSIGIFVRYIDFTSSQIALVRAIVGSIFLIVLILPLFKIKTHSLWCVCMCVSLCV